MSSRVSFAVVAVALLLLAGCTTPVDSVPRGFDHDPHGWEAGYWANSSLPVDESDGLTESELDAVVARMMARVETIRGLEYTRRVPVDVISRETFRDRDVNFGTDTSDFQAQVYEGLFLVPETRNTSDAVEEVYSSSVVGYYTGSRIVIITDSPGAVRISRGTLVHELTHALQHQQRRLSVGSPNTSDAQRAATSVIEGEANYVMDRYLARCGVQWHCIRNPPSGGGGGGTYNQGLFLLTYVPYAEGPPFVAAMRTRGDWAAFDRTYTSPPVSMEQVIHPAAYPDDAPVALSVAESAAGWTRFDRGHDRLGEAALYAMLQANGVIPQSHLRSSGSGGYTPARYNYSHPLTTGWEGDRFVAYRNGDRRGYAWVTAWESPADARAFHDAYLSLLRQRGATQVRDGVYRIPERRPYGDAFRVTLSGTRVRIVNAPTVSALDEIHPP